MSKTRGKTKSASVVCAIDSMILICWLAPGSKTSSEVILRSKLLQDILAEENATILIPTVAVAELLAGIPSPLERMNFTATLQAAYYCPTFDLRAAELAATLWQSHKKLHPDEQIQDRNYLKADIQIIATACAAGASRFYSHDHRCRALAATLIETHDLPERHPNVFVESDIRAGIEPPKRTPEKAADKLPPGVISEPADVAAKKTVRKKSTRKPRN